MLVRSVPQLVRERLTYEVTGERPETRLIPHNKIVDPDELGLS